MTRRRGWVPLVAMYALWLAAVIYLTPRTEDTK